MGRGSCDLSYTPFPLRDHLTGINEKLYQMERCSSDVLLLSICTAVLHEDLKLSTTAVTEGQSQEEGLHPLSEDLYRIQQPHSIGSK